MRFEMTGIFSNSYLIVRRRKLLNNYVLQTHHLARGLASYRVLKSFQSIFRIRYLFIAGTVSGVYVANKYYEDLCDKWPDFGPIKQFMPSQDQIDKIVFNSRDLFNSIKKQISFKESDAFSKLLPTISNKIVVSQKFIEPSQEHELRSNDKSLTEENPLLSKFSAVWGSSQKTSMDKRIEELQDEMIKNQTRYQKEIEALEKENRELRKQAMLRNRRAKNASEHSIGKSLIDLYSDVLDELAVYDSDYNVADSLPRVVVVGDQSSGKTSVLEMIAQARIFPRGAGEMMTRSPVKVTLSEGPYHVARFSDSSHEFDLTKDGELEALRHEIELRMKRSVPDGRTISTETISLSVQGPGLQRMVLVDLPGIISTQTSGMAPDTRDSIRQLAQQHMRNPNAIILCIQDGSIDAERSNVTDLVAQMDPKGKRTIFVLTKVDLAEQNLLNPNRIQKILEGRLFPMKALGYFGVVTGKGGANDSIAEIRAYEEKFFATSNLFRNGILKLDQLTTANLSKAVSQRFWRMVSESVEQQSEIFRATRFNLETEWKNTFPRHRQLDRFELFEKARSEILDEIIALSQVSAKDWERLFNEKLWDKVADYAFEAVLLESSQTPNLGAYNTQVDIKLNQWADRDLPTRAVEVGWTTLYEQLEMLAAKIESKRDHDPLFDALKRAVREESFRKHRWDAKAEGSLRVIQSSALDDRAIHNKAQWDMAVAFMDSAVRSRLESAMERVDELKGPGRWKRWSQWKSRTLEQINNSEVLQELETVLRNYPGHGLRLLPDEITTARRNLEARGVNVTQQDVTLVWAGLYRRHFLERAVSVATDCRKGYHYYARGFSGTEPGGDCREVVVFHRLARMLDSTCNALRQQLMNNEARRLERIIKDVLDEFGEDSERLGTLITGRRVQLAEEIKRVRTIQDKLERFIEALNKER